VKRASKNSTICNTRIGAGFVAALLWPLAAAAQEGVSETPAIADFGGFWNHPVRSIDFENAPDGGPGPVQNTLEINGRNPVWVGDHTNPILQEWTAEIVREKGEMALNSRGPATAQELCMPSGVPNDHTLMGPLHIVQSEDIVLIVHQRDHQIRRVLMNQKHSENIAPSWYGESVGHYEGNTLVVDTIGLNDRTVTDRNGTPHSNKIHVVERYRVAEDRSGMDVQFNVTDPGAFTMAWSGMVRYRPIANQAVLQEVICAENNFDVVTKEMYPIPEDHTPDF
jgi:hypothetical protein